MTDPASITPKLSRKPKGMRGMRLCFHTFGDWTSVDRDEIGGRTLARHCTKCQHKQTRFSSNVSPIAD